MYKKEKDVFFVDRQAPRHPLAGVGSPHPKEWQPHLFAPGKTLCF